MADKKPLSTTKGLLVAVGATLLILLVFGWLAARWGLFFKELLT